MKDEEAFLVYAGIDTHKENHALCLVDQFGRKISGEIYPANKEGYAMIAKAIGEPKNCGGVGIEGTMSYGSGIYKYLQSKGYKVFEILGPKVDRHKCGVGKSDLIDAERAAQMALKGQNIYSPKSADGWVEALRALHITRNTYVKITTSITNIVKSLLVTAPNDIRDEFASIKNVKNMMASLSEKREVEDVVEQALFSALQSLALTWIDANKKADELEEEMRVILEEHAPALLVIEGCGTLTSAQLAITAGDNPRRMKNKNAFAALCGVSPVPASTGDNGRPKRYRLNRGGDRHANCALYRIVKSRLAYDEQTKAYVEKRKSEGKTKKEIIRCLKRYVANEVYRALCNPKEVPDWQGSKLRELRKSLGLTQADIASMLKVSRTKIGQIERGECRHLRLEEQYCKAIERLASQEIAINQKSAA